MGYDTHLCYNAWSFDWQVFQHRIVFGFRIAVGKASMRTLPGAAEQNMFKYTEHNYGYK